jgi:urea transport system substrate-binding protein
MPAEMSFLDPPQAPGELGRLGGYRVLRILGQGGMGIVFEGEDPVLGRRVALKVPLGALRDENDRKRFLREARIAATLPHDHIAAIFQAGEQRDVPFLAMELLRGEPLDRRLEREKTLPVAEALRIGREVAEGLAAAHAQGLIHRDIKPANIWLEAPTTGAPRTSSEGAQRAAAGRVKLLDFGIARQAGGEAPDRITQSGLIVGSIGYMAPEQALCGELDGRTDLFSLGCVLHQMLTGRLPFTGESTYAALHALVYQNREASREVAPHLPRAVADLIDELLQKEPAKRPPSAAAVAERIEAIERELTRDGTTPPRKLTGFFQSPRVSSGTLLGAGVVILALIVGLIALFHNLSGREKGDHNNGVEPGFTGPPIKVGVLFSRTGVMQASEMPVAEMILFAIDEINADGGVLGRKVEAVRGDGRSRPEVFASEAEKLILRDEVTAIFGCWTSSSRKAVGEVCRSHNNLLVYPVNCEGLELNPYVVYAAGGPNQQMIPAIEWASGIKNRSSFFCVGSDYVYSHACNAILRDQIALRKGKVVGERYVSLHDFDNFDFNELAQEIKKSEADCILNSIDGQRPNLEFFRALRRAGISAETMPSISFSIGEDEVVNLDDPDVVGHYASSNYFQSLDNPINKAFLERFKARYPLRVVDDAMEAGYNSVQLWKLAVTKAGTPRSDAVREAFRGVKYDGPEGPVVIDSQTLNACRIARIGKVVNNQEFEVVWKSPTPMAALPFPGTRTRKQWETFLHDLYVKWGNQWEAPSP